MLFYIKQGIQTEKILRIKDNHVKKSYLRRPEATLSLPGETIVD
jgi:hypothetical protein